MASADDKTGNKTGDIEVVGLEHINLLMPEGREAEARAFYSALLGLAEVPKAKGLEGYGGLWFRLGDLTLHLGTDENFVPAKKAHPAFLVTDLLASRAALERAGVSVLPDARVPHVRRFYVSDPFGNRLEFIQAGDRF